MISDNAAQNNVASDNTDANNKHHATNLGRFMSMRGHLLIKEFRDFGTINTTYGQKISLSSLIISIASADNKQGEINFGAKFEETDTFENTRAAFLDFDEIDDFISALYFLENLAKQMAGQDRDYTEIIYSTKDDIQYGFFQQQNKQQQAFINVKGYGDVIFLSLEQLFWLKQGMMQVKRHLTARGAKRNVSEI